MATYYVVTSVILSLVASPANESWPFLQFPDEVYTLERKKKKIIFIYKNTHI